ncbi:MAG: hypothetical protein EAZ24_05950 [Burkholderiales bacterium]|nr:MAG: hypothetical protein EAZ24_05950 [Burkholderiales bacterium]
MCSALGRLLFSTELNPGRGLMPAPKRAAASAQKTMDFSSPSGRKAQLKLDSESICNDGTAEKTRR